ALAFVGLIALWLLPIPYEATLCTDNELVFRGYARKQCFYVEDLSRIERKTGEQGVYWVFSFIDGSSQLAGEAGRELAEVLCELTPRVVTSHDPRSGSSKNVFLKVRRAPAQPEWVRRGEKKSAQDWVRQDREATRELSGSGEGALERHPRASGRRSVAV